MRNIVCTAAGALCFHTVRRMSVAAVPTLLAVSQPRWPYVGLASTARCACGWVHSCANHSR